MTLWVIITIGACEALVVDPLIDAFWDDRLSGAEVILVPVKKSD